MHELESVSDSKKELLYFLRTDSEGFITPATEIVSSLMQHLSDCVARGAAIERTLRKMTASLLVAYQCNVSMHPLNVALSHHSGLAGGSCPLDD